MITQNLNEIKKVSSSSLSGLAQIIDFNLGKLTLGLKSFLKAISYDDAKNKMVLGQLDVKGITHFFSTVGFGPNSGSPLMTISADGKLTGQGIAAPVINVTRLRFADFNDVSNISRPGIPGEVVYVGPGPYTEGIYAFLTSTGWTALTGSGGGGGGSSTLSGLSDVSLDNIQNGDFLQYDTSENKWVNSQFEINLQDFFDALDNELTNPHVPYWNGAILTNSLIQNDTVNGVVNILGDLTAASKSFLIPHPTKKNHMLRYGSLEGPEHGVYVRGKSTSSKIKLPKYWKNLIDEDSISVNITPIGGGQELYVESIDSTTITIGGSKKKSYFFTIFAERKDINKLTVEFKNKSTR